MLLSARGARGPARVNVPATAGQARPAHLPVRSLGERPVVPTSTPEVAVCNISVSSGWTVDAASLPHRYAAGVSD